MLQKRHKSSEGNEASRMHFLARQSNLFFDREGKSEVMSLEIRSSRARGLSAARIIFRILTLAAVPKLQSELLEEILVSRSTLSRYIGFLLDKGLLEEVEVDRKTRLKTSSRGEHYLKTGSIN
jgi:DNA-binding MarR family transcriptional regulator